MKTGVAGVRSYEQKGVTKYQSELWVNEKHYQKRGFLSLDEAAAYRKELEEKYLPQKIIRYEPEKIVETYRKTESIRETALQHDMSRIKVRKILITEGIYSTPESIKVNDLLNEGFATEEVAEKLGISIGRAIRASRLWKTVRWRTTRTAGTSLSMPWRSASTGSVMESWWILSEEWRTCVKKTSARRSIRTLPSVTIPCV